MVTYQILFKTEQDKGADSPHYSSPLAQLIRQTNSIKGRNISGDVHKLALYADDVLLYISEPNTSLPKLFQTQVVLGTMPVIH